MSTAPRILILFAMWFVSGCTNPEPPVPLRPNGVCNAELIAALRARDLQAVKELLARHASVQCTEAETAARKTPLDLAVASGQLELVTVVIAAGANPGREISAIYGAVRLGRVDIARLLLDAGASANSHRGLPILQEAIEGGDARIVSLLLQRGADPNKRWWSRFAAKMWPVDACPITPLMEAAAVGATEVIPMLLAAGADRTQQDCIGATAADYAAEYNHTDAQKLLMR